MLSIVRDIESERYRESGNKDNTILLFFTLKIFVTTEAFWVEHKYICSCFWVLYININVNIYLYMKT